MLYLSQCRTKVDLWNRFREPSITWYWIADIRSSTAVPPELIGRIAPTRTEGINLRDVFSFPIEQYAQQLLPTLSTLQLIRCAGDRFDGVDDSHTVIDVQDMRGRIGYLASLASANMIVLAREPVIFAGSGGPVYIISVSILLLGSVFIGRCMIQWLPPAYYLKAAEGISDALRSGKYHGVLLLFLRSVVASILAPDAGPARPGLRLLWFSTVLLLTVLAMADLKFGTLFGMTESPWTSYKNGIATAIRSAEAPPPVAQNTPEFVAARERFAVTLHDIDRPIAGIVYAVVSVFAVIFANHVFLFLSLVITRRLLGDILEVSSWSAKLGTIAALVLVSIVIALACTVTVGIFCNPVVWVVVGLSAAMKSVVVFVIGTIMALLFEWWLAGPWFKVLLVVALLPSLCTVLLAGADSANYARLLALAHIDTVAISPFLARTQNMAIPLVSTILILSASAILIWCLP